MKKGIYTAFVLLSCSFLGQATYSSIAQEKNHQPFAINLRPRSVVLGPNVTLGDLGNIYLSDRNRRKILSQIDLGQAPPPGEGREISLSYIKRRLRTEGLGEFIALLSGPKRVRVITAQIEIDKAFLSEQFALRKERAPGVGRGINSKLL